MFKQKVKKYLKLGSLILAPTIPLVANTSISSAISREYVSLKIGNEKMTFKNISEATNYVMRNKVDAETEIKIGEPKYLNKNTGWIDPSSLHEYKANGKNMAPAYKMMNGKYTFDRKKALNSFLGRSHLVAQYYDGEEFHEGNAIGLKAAKDAILSRQLEEVVPYYDVDLGSSSVRINPFNKDDVHYLQDEALKVYKNSNINQAKDDEHTHVTTSYLLPTKDGKEISLYPKHPGIGLQISDLFGGIDINDLVSEYLKENITFTFQVTFLQAFRSPYKFRRVQGKPANTEKVEINEDEKTITVKDIKFKDLLNSNSKVASDVFAFMDHDEFWRHFTWETNKWNYNDVASNWAKNNGDGNFFGETIYIANDDPWRNGGNIFTSLDGFDTTINDHAAHNGGNGYSRFYTIGSLIPNNVPTKDDIDTKLKEFLKNKSILKEIEEDSIDSIDHLINQIVQSNLQLNNSNSPSNNIDIAKFFNMKNLNTTDRTITYNTIDNVIQSLPGHMLNHTNKTIANFTNQLSKMIDHTNTKKSDLNIKNFIKLKDLNKVLFVNKTPIGKLDSNDNIIERGVNFYNKITPTTKNGNDFYIFSNKNDAWTNIKKKTKNGEDFMKQVFIDRKVVNNIDENNFGNFNSNKIYSKATPLLMLQNGTYNYKPIRISKILTDSYGVKSVHKMDHSEFFNSDIDIKHRKQQINEDFFEPALVYVIYNDNDEIIDEFKPANNQKGNNNLRFDDAQTINNNAKAILTDYIRKDTSVVFIKKYDGNWMDQPIANKVISVYNLKWNNRKYMFEHFENIKTFIEKWVKNNSTTIVVKG